MFKFIYALFISAIGATATYFVGEPDAHFTAGWFFGGFSCALAAAFVFGGTK